MLAVLYIVLGMALDGISMIVLTAAIVLPMIQKAGFDLVWFGIFIVLLVEIAEVTPPGGLQPLRAAEHDGQGLATTIARASLPFFAMLVVAHRHHHGVSAGRDVAAGLGDGARETLGRQNSCAVLPPRMSNV